MIEYVHITSRRGSLPSRLPSRPTWCAAAVSGPKLPVSQRSPGVLACNADAQPRRLPRCRRRTRAITRAQPLALPWSHTPHCRRFSRALRPTPRRPASPQADQPYDEVQFTLVDCPGHASLIRTIIGGAQIIDMMMLVVDVTKGIQTQTAECLVVGELTTPNLVLVLNKTDLLPADGREVSSRVRAAARFPFDRQADR